MAVRKHLTYFEQRKRDLFARANGLCAICGRRCLQNAVHGHPLKATVDHIIPLAHGGKDTVANVQLACTSCNNAKSDAYDKAATTAIARQRVELAAVLTRQEEARAKLVAREEGWKIADAGFRSEIASLKETIRAQPEGDLRYHLHCLEDGLKRCLAAVERETSLEDARRAVRGIVALRMAWGERVGVSVDAEAAHNSDVRTWEGDGV